MDEKSAAVVEAFLSMVKSGDVTHMAFAYHDGRAWHFSIGGDPVALVGACATLLEDARTLVRENLAEKKG